MTGLREISRGSWPESAEDTPATLPQVPGFIVSSFNPLVTVVANRCLGRRTDEAPPRTALVLVSASGDRGTAQALQEAVRTGRRVPALLFFQSNPNAVLGHVAARHRLTGPLVCLGPVPGGGKPGARALAEAELLLLDGDADEVLVITAEQGADSSGGAAAGVTTDIATDTAEAVLVALPHLRKEGP